jgi:hypothetical protein
MADNTTKTSENKGLQDAPGKEFHRPKGVVTGMMNLTDKVVADSRPESHPKRRGR